MTTRNLYLFAGNGGVKRAALFVDGARHQFGGHTWDPEIPSSALLDYLLADSGINVFEVDRRVVTTRDAHITKESDVEKRLRLLDNLQDAQDAEKVASAEAERIRRVLNS